MIILRWAIVCVVVSLFSSGCTPSKMMTYSGYQDVMIGDNIFDVQSFDGNPYEIRDIGDGKQEYVYMERIPTAEGVSLFREYVLIVADGKVIEKRMHESKPSPIQMEMQQ